MRLGCQYSTATACGAVCTRAWYGMCGTELLIHCMQQREGGGQSRQSRGQVGGSQRGAARRKGARERKSGRGSGNGWRKWGKRWALRYRPRATLLRVVERPVLIWRVRVWQDVEERVQMWLQEQQAEVPTSICLRARCAVFSTDTATAVGDGVAAFWTVACETARNE